jgi:choline-sulfatase
MRRSARSTARTEAGGARAERRAASGLDRREFLAAGAAAAAGALLGGCRPGVRAPNLLLVLTDDQHHHAIGYASAGSVRTPQLDRLARAGTIFETAHASALPCAPARGCLLAGRYRWPRTGEAVRRLRPGEWTFARALAHAGYHTGLVGKMHMKPMRADIGFQQAEYSEHAIGRRVGPGQPFEDDFERWLAGFGLEDWQDTRRIPPAFRDSYAEFERNHGAQPWPYAQRFHPISWVRDRAIAYLGERAARAEPFCLVVSFRYPHGPFNPSQRFAALYDPAAVELPTDHWTDMEGLPPSLRAFADIGWYPRDAFAEPVLRRVLAYYYALVTQIDDAVGAVLRHVDLSRTLVVFTSDHGDYLGERGRIGKHPWLPFEPLVRVPLFAAGAGVPAGQVVTAPVAHVDLAPTFLRAAGVPVPPELDGIALQRYWTEPGFGGRRAVFCHGTFLMTRRGPLKYFRSLAGDSEMLFDLAHDPGELVNLAGQPAWSERRAALAAELDRVYAPPLEDLRA